MSSNRKICVVTGTRAEYGLLYPLMRGINNSDGLELQTVVTSMHLSPEFGMTCELIEKDGFFVNYKVETLLSSDSEVGIGKSMGLGMIGFADAFSILKPDVLLVLGDRFEIFSVVSVATVARIPVFHIHGGETTQGVYDEAFRHSITKMAHLHFTATNEYYNRVIQLGESPDRVFNVGSVGIDNINNLPLFSKDLFEQKAGLKLDKYNLLITFHPVTLEESTAGEQFYNILSVLDDLNDTNLFFTMSNSDTNGRVINRMIKEYVDNNLDKSIAYISMGQLRYLSAMQYMDGVVGNSSSGIIEAPSFNIGTINIGDRQKGRVRANSVIDCDPTIASIKKAINKLYSRPFQENLKTVKNPYGEGGASNKILEIIKNYSIEKLIFKKFCDLK
jgi:GDP/UDP-N,N'-diacetylbacillosamine 2-epimerase (hydrolysing)